MYTIRESSKRKDTYILISYKYLKSVWLIKTGNEAIQISLKLLKRRQIIVEILILDPKAGIYPYMYTSSCESCSRNYRKNSSHNFFLNTFITHILNIANTAKLSEQSQLTRKHYGQLAIYMRCIYFQHTFHRLPHSWIKYRELIESIFLLRYTGYRNGVIDTSPRCLMK